MTAEFNELGFHFLYPENWTLVREENRSWPRSVSVHSPQGAFWTVTRDQRPSDELLGNIVELMRSEYEELESEFIERKVGPISLYGSELNFYLLDLLITAQVLASRDQPGVVFLLQGENRDFAQLLNVFDAMTLSLLQNLREV